MNFSEHRFSSPVIFLLVFFSVAFSSGCSKEKGLKVTGFSPKQGSADGGGTVTIHGNGFTQSGAMGVEVYFGDKKARFLNFDGDTEMLVAAPPGTKDETVDIEVFFGDTRGRKFPGAYTYVDLSKGFGVDALAPSDKK